MSQTTSMDKSAVFSKLNDLAANPFDLTQAGALEGRFEKFNTSAAGLSYVYGCQRINEDVMDALQQLADQTSAVSQFSSMVGGEVINKIDGYECENRQVLHTAMRDVFDDLPEGFLSDVAAINGAKEELAKLKIFCDEINSGALTNAQGESFNELVLVGIGGSDLGPRAIYLALKKFGIADRKVHFISNVDPDDAAAVLRDANLSRSLCLVISKSGSTLETLTNETLVASKFEAAGLELKKHFICVTGKGSPMDNPAKYLRSFYMFDYIGGRFSVTSMVGAVMLSFALGFDNYMDFLRGARKIDLNSQNKNVRENLPLLMAVIGIWNRNFLNNETLAVLPYSQSLSRFAAHLQQCDMESNGKRVNRQGEAVDFATGPIVWGEPGTNGQHAFYQLIHQSETVVPCDFIGFKKSQYEEDLNVKETTSQQKLLANLFAQSIGLATGTQSDNPNKVFPGNRPNSMLFADQLTPEIMGALLALYENKIAFQGFIWNINSFDQEGVQLGKVLANEIIDIFTGKDVDAAVAKEYLKVLSV